MVRVMSRISVLFALEVTPTSLTFWWASVLDAAVLEHSASGFSAGIYGDYDVVRQPVVGRAAVRNVGESAVVRG